MKKPGSANKTAKGIKLGTRKRTSVMKDFEKISGPLQGQNRDRKPEA
jgi:hypothetical protein